MVGQVIPDGVVTVEMMEERHKRDLLARLQELAPALITKSREAMEMKTLADREYDMTCSELAGVVGAGNVVLALTAIKGTEPPKLITPVAYMEAIKPGKAAPKPKR
jgi:hypothetical protein